MACVEAETGVSGCGRPAVLAAGCWDWANASGAATSSRPQRIGRNGRRDRTSRLIIVKRKAVVLSLQHCLLRTVKVQYRCPLPLPLGSPHHFAAKQSGDGLRRKVLMKVEKAFIEGLVPAAQAQGQMGRVIFGRKNEPDGVRIIKLCRFFNLLK